MNTEHPRYPLHYFAPSNESGLVELALVERCNILAEEGNYAVLLLDLSQPGYRTDAFCACENARIPTHRHPDSPALPTSAERLKELLEECQVKP